MKQVKCQNNIPARGMCTW